MLPAVLASALGGQRLRPVGVVSGLVVSFAFFTLSLTWLVSQLGISADSLRLGGAVVIGLFGLVLVAPPLLGCLEALTARLPGLADSSRSGGGYWGGALVGASLGVVWAPCAGPILAAVAALVATSRLTPQAVVVMISYSLGAGLPMLAIAYGGRRALSRARSLNRHSATLQRVFGVVMIAFALTLFAGVDRTVQVALAQVVPPEWTDALTAIEDRPQVRSGLASLGPDGTSVPKATTASAPAAQTTASVATPPAPAKSTLRDLGPAPELRGIVGWLNGEPVTLASLRGKVVLVDFWTYSCINCIRTLPYVTEWDRKYRDSGLVVLGVHTPEFEFEKSRANVEQAVEQYGIRYLVAQDNNYATWQAFDNSYWPAEYFVDANGRIRYEHFGEGGYDESDAVIRDLLAEAGLTASAGIPAAAVSASSVSAGRLLELITPETYLGALLQKQQLVSPERGLLGRPRRFSLPTQVPPNCYALDGEWTVGAEEITASAGARLDLSFYADQVYLVLKPGVADARVEILLDGASIGDAKAGRDVRSGVLTVEDARLYNLVDLRGKPGQHTLSLRFEDGGTSAYAFTFG